MKHYRVLVLAKTLSDLLVRLINDFEAFSANGISDTPELYKTELSQYHLLLIGGGISDDEITEIRTYLKGTATSLPIIEHFGGGSGLLKQELLATVDQLTKQ